MIKNRLFGLVVMLGVLMGFANLGFAEPQLNINDLSTDGQILELDNDVDMVVLLDGCDTNELAEATYTILTSGIVEDGNSQTLQCYDSNCTERILISDFMFGDEITVAFDANTQLGILSLVNNEEIDINGVTIPSGTKIYDLTFFYTSEQNDITVFGFNYDMLNYTEPEVQQEVELESIELGGGEMMFMMESLEGDNVPEYPVWPDLNTDNIINFLDFARFAENWQKTGAGLEGDFDNDNDVDAADLIQIAYFWLETENPADFPYITSFEESQGFTQSMDMNDVSNWVITGQGQALVAQASFTEDSNSFSYNYVAVDSNTTLSKLFTVTTALNNTYLRISCIPTNSSYIRILDRSNVVAALRFGDPCDANDPNMYIYDNGSFTDTGFNYRTAVNTCRINLAAQNSYEDCWMEFKFNFDWQNSSYDVNYGSSVFDANFTDAFLTFNEIQFETGTADANTFNINRISVSDETTAGGVLGDGNDIWITSPSVNTVIEGRYVIEGTVWFDELSRYEIKTCPSDLNSSDPNNWSLIFKGSKIVKNGTLGCWDSESFKNGAYYVRMDVYDDLGRKVILKDSQNQSSDGVMKTDVSFNGQTISVNSQYALNGLLKGRTFTHTEQPDIELNWPGQFPFSFQRTYSQGLKNYVLPFYYGWTHNHNIKIFEDTRFIWEKNGGVPLSDGHKIGISNIWFMNGASCRLFEYSHIDTNDQQNPKVIYKPADNESDYIERTSAVGTGSFDLAYSHHSPDGVQVLFEQSDIDLPYSIPSTNEGVVNWSVNKGADRKQDRLGNALVYTWYTYNGMDTSLHYIESQIAGQQTTSGVKIILKNGNYEDPLYLCEYIQLQYDDQYPVTLETFEYWTDFVYVIFNGTSAGPGYEDEGAGYGYNDNCLETLLYYHEGTENYYFGFGDYGSGIYLTYNEDDQTISSQIKSSSIEMGVFNGLYDDSFVDPFGDYAQVEKYEYENLSSGELLTKIDFFDRPGAYDDDPNYQFKSKEVLQNRQGLVLSDTTDISGYTESLPASYYDYLITEPPLSINEDDRTTFGGGGYINTQYSYENEDFPSRPTTIYEYFDDNGDGTTDNGSYDRPTRTTTCTYDSRGNLTEQRVYAGQSEFVRTTYDYHQDYNFMVRKTTWQDFCTESQLTVEGKKVCQEWWYGDVNGVPSQEGDEGDYLVMERTLISEANDIWSQTSYNYYPNGRIKTKTVQTASDSNDITFYEYDPNSFLAKEWQGVVLNNGLPAGNPTRRYYNSPAGKPLLEADYLGQVKMNLYDNRNNVTKIRKYYDANAMSLNDVNFVPSRYDDPDNSYDDNNYLSVEFFGWYDQFGNLRGRNLATGARINYKYEPGKYIGPSTFYANIGYGEWSGVEYKMASDGRIKDSVEFGLGALNRFNYYLYDAMDRQSDQFRYEKDGEYYYDSGNISTFKHEQYVFDGSGNKIIHKTYDVNSQADPSATATLERNTVCSYDILDRMVCQVEDACDVQENPDGQNITAQFGYDAAGNRTYIIDPEGNYIFTDYDNGNRKICEYFACQPVYFYGIVDFVSTKASAAKKKEYQYYLDGQVKSITSYDTDGNTLLEYSEFAYDGRGRIQTVTQQVDDSNDAITVYDYNDVGFTRNVTPADPNKYHIRITDAENKQTWISLNYQGKPQKIVYPSGDYEETIYDGNGIAVQKSVWDSNGTERTILFDYDPFGKTTKITYPDGGYLDFEYVGRFLGNYGKVSKITDHRLSADRPGSDGSTFEFGYDYVSENIDYYKDASGYTIDYKYNQAYPDCKKSIVVKNSSQSEIYNVSYLYDLSGRLLDVNDNLSTAGYENIAGFGYDNNGNRSQLKYWLSGVENDYDTAMVIAYSYDTENNLASIGASRSYYDPNFGLVCYYDPNFAFDANSGNGIDGLGRLFDANEIITVAGQNRMWNLDFTYDMLSQLTSAQLNRPDTNGIDWSLAYQYSKDGNIDQKTVNGGQPTVYGYYGDLMTDIGNDQLDWDENGRLIFTPTIDFEYNWDGKLRNATIGSDSIALKYDPMGNRVIKNSTINGNRKYIVDIAGGLPVVLCEIDPCDSSLTNSYFYADGQVLCQQNDSGYYYYVHDRLGSVRLVVNENGGIVNSYTYNPFGEDLANDCNETVYNPFKYTGQWYDNEIGQYYLRARMYDPALGRFTSRDPVSGKFGKPLTLHKYLYCNNNIVNMIDPTGWLGIGAAIQAGYEAHYTAVGVVAYGVGTGNNNIISLGVAMEKMVAPVMAIAVASWKGRNPRSDVDKMIDDYDAGVSANYDGGGPGWGKFGKWGAITVGLVLLSSQDDFRDMVNGLFDFLLGENEAYIPRPIINETP